MKTRQLVTLVMPLEMYRQVGRLAIRENKPISSIIREAVAAHLDHTLGVEVPYAMPRGGWRERKGG
jgi:predicted DNA-binding protein